MKMKVQVLQDQQQKTKMMSLRITQATSDQLDYIPRGGRSVAMVNATLAMIQGGRDAFEALHPDRCEDIIKFAILAASAWGLEGPRVALLAPGLVESLNEIYVGGRLTKAELAKGMLLAHVRACSTKLFDKITT